VTATLPHLVWEVRPPGTDVVMRTDDLTLEEIEAAEDSSGVPWLFLTPTSAKGARAFLTLGYIRAGLSDGEVVARVKQLRSGDLDGVFTVVPARRTPPAPPAPAGTGSAEDPTAASS
jgi:hypothetical protein